MCILRAKSCLTLCSPTICSPPGSSVHGISQARMLEWVVISFSRGSFQPRNWTYVYCIGRGILYHWATREPHMLWTLMTTDFTCTCSLMPGIQFGEKSLSALKAKQSIKTPRRGNSKAISPKCSGCWQSLYFAKGRYWEISCHFLTSRIGGVRRTWCKGTRNRWVVHCFVQHQACLSSFATKIKLHFFVCKRKRKHTETLASHWKTYNNDDSYQNYYKHLRR